MPGERQLATQARLHLRLHFWREIEKRSSWRQKNNCAVTKTKDWEGTECQMQMFKLVKVCGIWWLCAFFTSRAISGVWLDRVNYLAAFQRCYSCHSSVAPTYYSALNKRLYQWTLKKSPPRKWIPLLSLWCPTHCCSSPFSFSFRRIAVSNYSAVCTTVLTPSLLKLAASFDSQRCESKTIRWKLCNSCHPNGIHAYILTHPSSAWYRSQLPPPAQEPMTFANPSLPSSWFHPTIY